MAEHQCPDCGKVYPCRREPHCFMDFLMRCTPCAEKRQRYYTVLLKGIAATAKEERGEGRVMEGL